MKTKRRFRQVLAILLSTAMIFSCMNMAVTAETTTADASEQVSLMEQTIDVVLFSDNTYSTALDTDAAITISSTLPEGTTAKAYPVTVDAENVRAAYNITLFDASGAEYEPESAVTVDISTSEIETAIESGAELTAYHIADDETTEEVAIVSQDGSTITFEADSFSIYYIVGGTDTTTGTNGNVTYRRTYVFYNLTSGKPAGSTDKNDYEPYYFTIERGGRTMQTNEQTLTEGESLLVPQLPYHDNDAFAGWYVGTESDGNVTFGEKAVFDTAITGIQASCAQTGMDETIPLYALYGTEKYLTFYFEPEDDEKDDMVYFVEPVVVPKDSEVEIQLFDYTKQGEERGSNVEDRRYVKAPVPSTKNVFLGWSTNRAESKASASSDPTTATIRGNRTNTIKFKNVDGTVSAYVNGSNAAYTGSFDFYPIYDEANWVSFDGGASGNGASYQAPIYVVTTDPVTSLPKIKRDGYTFGGWYYDTACTIPVTDANGNIVNVNNAEALTKMTVTEKNGGGYTFLPAALTGDDELILYAKWEADEATYKIAFWAQKDTVHYDTSSGSAWKSNALSNYDFITAVDSSRFGQKAPTEGNESITDIRTNYLNYLSTVPSGSEYVDTSKFFYNDEKTKADVESAGTKISGDGSTVINIFYDRVWYTFSFFDTTELYNTNSYNSLTSTNCKLYRAITSSSYTYYYFGGGYVFDNNKYTYYSSGYYLKEEGPFPSTASTPYQYFEYSNGSFGTAKTYSRDGNKYNAGSTVNKRIIDLYGVDISGQWPTIQNYGQTFIERKTLTSSESEIYRSNMFIMPNEHRYYYRHNVTADNDWTHKVKYYDQQFDKSYSFNSKVTEDYFWNDQLVYTLTGISERKGFTIAALLGSNKALGTSGTDYDYTKEYAYLNPAIENEDSSGIPLPSNSNNILNEKTDNNNKTYSIVAYKNRNGTTDNTYYWDIYYARNKYKLNVVDAGMIDFNYISTSLYYDEDAKSQLLSYEEFSQPYARLGYDAETATAYFKKLFSGEPVILTNRKLINGDNRLYTFGGVYTDSTCQPETLVYDATTKQHISQAGFDKMPDHDVTLYVKWNLVDLRVDIDPSEGELTSQTERTFFWVDDGEKIKEYTKIARDYIRDDENGNHYYLYTPYTAAAQSGKQTGANAETGCKAKYIDTNSYTGNYDTVYQEVITEENGKKTYSYVPVEGQTYTAVTDPKIYPGAGSAYKYRELTDNDPRYNFIGWFKVDPTDNSLSLYNFNTETHEDTTLKAVWRSGQKYVIKYDANEYEFVNGTRTDTVVYTGKVQNAVTTYYKNAEQTYLNYGEGATAVVKYAAKADEANARAQFLYWVDKKGRRHDFNEVFTISNDMVETGVDDDGKEINIVRLTAHYSTIESVGLQYNANTGENSAVSAVEYYSKNSDVKLHSATRDKFENTAGYVIKSWNTKADGTGKTYKLNGTYGIDEEEADENGIITLYAQWGAPTVSVTFDPNGGTWSPTDSGLVSNNDGTYTATVNSGSTVSKPTTDPTTNTSGQVFLGWTADSTIAAQHDFTNNLDEAKSKLYNFNTAPTEDVTLYAVWAEAAKVYFNLNIYTNTYYNSNYSNHTWNETSDDFVFDNHGYTYLRSYYEYVALGDTVKKPADPSYYSSSYSNYKLLAWTTSQSYLTGVQTTYPSTSWDFYTPLTASVLPSSGYLDLYTSWINSESFTSVTITITNTVTGDGYDKDKEFEYRLDFTTTKLDNNSTSYIENRPSEVIKLKAGSSYSFDIYDYWTNNNKRYQSVSVTQTDYSTDGYTLSEVNSENTSNIYVGNVNSNKVFSISDVYKGDEGYYQTLPTTVTFTNTYTAPSTPGGGDTPTTTTDDNLTITGNTFTSLGDNRPDNVPLLNGDNLQGNTVTVNVAVVNSNGAIVDNLIVTGDPNSLNLYSDQLEKYKDGDYKIKVMLDVKNVDDDTVSLGDTYIKTGAANNAYSAITTGGTEQYIDGTNTVPWTKTDNNTYTVLVSDLFDNNGKLKGADAEGAAQINLYSQVRTEKISITYKFYDRDKMLAQNLAPDISPVEVTKQKNVTFGDSVPATITVNAPDVQNILDQVYWHGSQDAYEKALAKGTTLSMRGSTYYSGYYGTSGNTLHTDCYGRVPGQASTKKDGNDLYMSEYKTKMNKDSAPEENWVTYTDVNDDVVAENDITGDGKYRISSISVWGFNTPKPYPVKYVVPESAGQLSESYTYTIAGSAKNQVTVNFATAGDTVPEFGTYYFNQRLGAADGGTDKDGNYTDVRDAGTNHLTQYGKSFNDKVENQESSVTIGLNQFEGYTFDGWYIKDGKKYVKVYSDETFSERIITGITLYAGYTSTENTPEKTACGVTLTKNEVEYYINKDTGEERCRYVSMLNSYGYPGSDSDFKNKKMAMIYIIVDPTVSKTDLDAVTMAEILTANEDFEKSVTDAIDSENYPDTSLTVTITDVSKINNTYCFTYKIVDAGGTDEAGAQPITFSNKNRAQFSLDVNKDAAVNEGGMYSKIITIAAVQHGNDLVFSDNCLVYANGH